MFFQDFQKRGTLNGTQTAIASGAFEQQWGLDSTGNWKTFNMEATEAIERLAKMNAEGGSQLLNGTWELNQTRTTNKANEIRLCAKLSARVCRKAFITSFQFSGRWLRFTEKRFEKVAGGQQSATTGLRWNLRKHSEMGARIVISVIPSG